MKEFVIVFPFFVLPVLAVDLFRNVIMSPHSSSEAYFTGIDRQLAPPIAAAAPFPAEAVQPQAAFGAPAAAAFPAAVQGVGAAAFPAPLPAAAFPAPLAVGSAPVPAVPAVPAPVAAVPAVPAPIPAVPAVVAPPAVAPVAVKLDYPQYTFGYSVQDFTTGDNKMAKEVREGGIVKGSYSLADPDGTKRTVNYYADPIHGFNAVVHKTQLL